MKIKGYYVYYVIWYVRDFFFNILYCFCMLFSLLDILIHHLCLWVHFLKSTLLSKEVLQVLYTPGRSMVDTICVFNDSVHRIFQDYTLYTTHNNYRLETSDGLYCTLNTAHYKYRLETTYRLCYTLHTAHRTLHTAHCTALYCTRHCTAHYTVLHTALHCTELHCTPLHCTLHCTVLQTNLLAVPAECYEDFLHVLAADCQTEHVAT